MLEDRDALLQHYRQMRDDLVATVEGLSDELMTERTLDGWSVKDHLAHIAAWDELRASEVTRISAGYESAWRMSGDQDAAFNTVVNHLRREMHLSQVLWELESTHQRLFDALAAARPRGLDGSLYGEAGLRSQHEALHTSWIRRWRDEKDV